VIARALASGAALVTETLPEWLVSRERLWKFSDAVLFLHAPPPRQSRLTQQALDARTHPAWTRSSSTSSLRSSSRSRLIGKRAPRAGRRS
jgi:hypothetical protein